MERDIFSAGTAPGSPGNENEIKTLLCYLLAETAQPLFFAQIHEALREDALVNYFQLVEALEALVESEHLEKSPLPEGDSYTVTPLGRAVAETLDSSLPRSVREKAVLAAGRIVARQKRLGQVTAEILPLETGGFQLALGIPEEGANLITFSVYAPTKEQAEKLRRNFLNDPVFLYQAVMALLSGDLEVLGDLRPSREPLF